jgi:hypothetical protein
VRGIVGKGNEHKTLAVECVGKLPLEESAVGWEGNIKGDAK